MVQEVLAAGARRDSLSYRALRTLVELDAAVAKTIDILASGPAVALRKTKEAINAATLTELESTIGVESQGQLTLLDSHDFAEGTRAFQERRSPRFTDA